MTRLSRQRLPSRVRKTGQQRRQRRPSIWAEDPRKVCGSTKIFISFLLRATGGRSAEAQRKWLISVRPTGGRSAEGRRKLQKVDSFWFAGAAEDPRKECGSLQDTNVFHHFLGSRYWRKIRGSPAEVTDKCSPYWRKIRGRSAEVYISVRPTGGRSAEGRRKLQKVNIFGFTRKGGRSAEGMRKLRTIF